MGEKQQNANKEVIGHTLIGNIVKNKTAPPFKIASFDLMYGIGVDKVREIADYAILAGIMEKGGAWIKAKDESGEIISRKVGDEIVPLNFQGKDRFVEHLRIDTDLYDLISDSFYNKKILSAADLKN